jgi:catechol 2,3-dioxygenase-like lactoylglutathione lyase family enzyme
MFKDSNIMAVLPAKDINRAKAFYRDKLGIEPSESMEEGAVMYSCGQGTRFLLYQTDNAGTAKNTQMGWETDNLEGEMEELRRRGVAFELRFSRPEDGERHCHRQLGEGGLVPGQRGQHHQHLPARIGRSLEPINDS